ncbi:MAG: FAD-binding domain-containing protein [candidate division KSB1 bacterium]|nr:FAD-binding domain-containing protein [candidate division KSB1 bacterium]
MRFCSFVEKTFPDHPGSIAEFSLPTTRTQALSFFDDFLQNRFEQFGPYEDAINSEHPFLFHSIISPALNIGLVTPQDILDKLEPIMYAGDVHLPSLEGLIRQIVGWREYMYGMYRILNLKGNFFQQKRRLTQAWYEGTTGIPPLDHCIQKALRYGYLHHIERLMIVGNLMLLSGIHPKEVFTWFMELFVDSADWVMTPNVYGMSQFADGGQIATKPYIAGSNYILKMSNYKKGTWCDIADGLYWRFIEMHKDFFDTNPRMRIMTRALMNLDKNHKQTIFTAAESFIDRTTTL